MLDPPTYAATSCAYDEKSGIGMHVILHPINLAVISP